MVAFSGALGCGTDQSLKLIQLHKSTFSDLISLDLEHQYLSLGKCSIHLCH